MDLTGPVGNDLLRDRLGAPSYVGPGFLSFVGLITFGYFTRLFVSQSIEKIHSLTRRHPPPVGFGWLGLAKKRASYLP